MYIGNMKLIAGLGNPGAKYKNTRHNAGFMAIDEIFDKLLFQPFKKSDKFNAEIAEGQIADDKVLLAKPQTFMNLSGQSVAGIMNFYKIPAEDLIVIFDDADLPYGTLRIRPDGSAGGHKGVKSVIESIGSQGFVRLRLGIQPPPSFNGALEDYVLGKLTDGEKKNLQSVINQIPYAVGMILEGETEKAMNEFNS
jgi:peptidyl-tRNA hydrolase, PTH1 family